MIFSDRRNPAPRRRIAPLTLGALLAFTVLLLRPGFAQERQPALEAGAPWQFAPRSYRLFLRDAPVRSVYEMLCQAARRDYTMDNDVQGMVTMDAANLEYAALLDHLSRANTVPIAWRTENSVLFFGAKDASAPYSILFPAPPAGKEIPRRVAAILLGTDSSGQPLERAILETGTAPESDVRVVEVGGRVSSGELGVPDLIVEAIRQSGIVLRHGDRRLRIPLSRLRGLQVSRGAAASIPAPLPADRGSRRRR